MFREKYTLPVDKYIGHANTKWKPVQFCHLSLSGSVIKSLLLRVAREVCMFLARERCRRRSNPPFALSQAQLPRLLPPLPAAAGRGSGGTARRTSSPPEAPPSCQRPCARRRPAVTAPAPLRRAQARSQASRQAALVTPPA